MFPYHNGTPFSHKFNCTQFPPDEYKACVLRNDRLIVARVYFILAIVNFVYVIVMTGLFVYRATIVSRSSEKEHDFLEKEIQLRSLRQRGLFGSILNSLGYLTYSTCLLLFQSLFVPASCEVLLWGSLIGMYTWIFSLCWSTYRLYILIRLGTLKQLFLNKTTRVATDPKYRWFMQHKNFQALDAKRGLPIYTIGLILVVALCAITEAVILPEIRCRDYYGNYLIMAVLGLFFVVLTPIIWWRLRDSKDLHGIRNEILIQLLVSVPCITMYVVWTGVFQGPYGDEPSVPRVLFSPGNWAIIMTLAGHTFFIIIPLIRSYRKNKDLPSDPVDTGTYDIGRHDTIASLGSLQQQFLSSSIRRDAQTNLPRLPGTRPHYELTKNGLEEALNDPDAVQNLEQLAAKDFSVENILFYRQYLTLQKKIMESQRLQQQQWRQQRQQRQQWQQQQQGQPSSSTAPLNCDHHRHRYCDTPNVNGIAPSSTLSSTSIPIEIDEEVSTISQCETRCIPHDCIADCISLYQTFIPDSAPLQINISARARKLIEAKIAVHSNQSSSVISSDRESTCINEFDFTLDIFEKARSEVFWNIFTSVFPQFVSILEK